MLKYFSYYSVGGYKDLILGDSESKNDSTYYFSLLPVLEERAKSDSASAKQVAELKALPQIMQLSADNSYGLPSSARVLFSHAGYKLIYKHLEGDQYALALRDICQTSKDETGRSIPFLFVIIGDTTADVRTLDILAVYFACNIKQVEQKLSQLLYMDMEKNGLRFDLAEFNTWIRDIVNTSPSTTLPTLSGGFKIHANKNKVALLLLPNGISKDKSISEQRIDTNETVMIPISEVISKDDPNKLVDLLINVSKQLRDEKKRNEILKKGLVGAAVGGFIMGSIIASCCHK